MSALLTHDYAGLLQRREAELRAFLRAAAVAAVGSAGDPPEMLDFKDVAAEESRAAVDSVAVEQAARELGEIRSALQRIEDGSYGECLDCGDPIEERRLLALPATAYCTSCQAINERRPRTRR